MNKLTKKDYIYEIIRLSKVLCQMKYHEDDDRKIKNQIQFNLSKLSEIENKGGQKMNDVQKMLKDIMDKSKINQKELAKRIGVNPAQVSRWLISAEPKLIHYKKIKELYDKTAV